MKTPDGSACAGTGLMPCATSFTGITGDLHVHDVVVLSRASSYLDLAGLTVLKNPKIQEILEKSFLRRHKFFSKGTESLRAAIFAVQVCIQQSM